MTIAEGDQRITKEPIMTGRSRIALRAGLGLFCALEAFIGVWALGFPKAFYDFFPLPGHHWVTLLPPYNEHLITDYGSMSLALALPFAVALVTLNRLLVRTVLFGYLLYATPHLIFHAGHLDGFSTTDAIVQTLVLTLSVVLPLILLTLTRPPVTDAGPPPHGR